MLQLAPAAAASQPRAAELSPGRHVIGECSHGAVRVIDALALKGRHWVRNVRRGVRVVHRMNHVTRAVDQRERAARLDAPGGVFVDEAGNQFHEDQKFRLFLSVFAIEALVQRFPLGIDVLI